MKRESIMGKKLSIWICVLIAGSTCNMGFAQRWSAPAAVTDSISDNTNCIIYNILTNAQFEPTVFWEKRQEPGNASIYSYCLSGDAPPQLVLSAEGVDFRNPQISSSFETGSDYSLFYETDVNGNIDIYALRHLQSGRYSEPVPFATSSADDKNLSTSNLNMAWEQNGKILLSQNRFSGGKWAFSTPIILDSIFCSNPIAMDDYIVWQKSIKDSSRLFYAEYDHIFRQWLPPKSLFLPGHSTNVSWSRDWGHDVAWQSTIGSKTNVFYSDLYSAEVGSLDLRPGLNKTDPSILDAPKITKPSYVQRPIIIAFVGDSSGSEIYCSADNEYNQFYNISRNSRPDRNPTLAGPFQKSLYLFWESFVNKHWQLFVSRSSYDFGTVDQSSLMPGSMELRQNYPNPFNSTTEIRYSLFRPSEICLSIMNALGQEIKILDRGNQYAGDHTKQWDGTDAMSRPVTSGVYFVVLRLDRELLLRKIALIK